jgi:preprotein translocase subunit YajC
MNYLIVAFVILLIMILLIYLIIKNQKDKKDFEEDLNRSELKPEKHGEQEAEN